MPAVGALPPRITTRDQLARLQGMRGLSIRLSNCVGPAVGGVLLAARGAAGAFTAAGVLFGLSLVLLLAVRVAPALPSAAARSTPWRELREGLRYVCRHPMLAPLAGVIGLSEMCFSGPVALGLVLLADERGWGASGTGWMASAFSVGAAAAGVWITAAPRIPRAGPSLITALLVTATATTALGRAPSLPTAIALTALIGLASGTTVTLTGALVQAEADPRFLGRVTSLTTLCMLGLDPALFPVAGITAQLWGAGTFFTGCGVISLAAVALAGVTPALRRARLQGTPGEA